MNSRASVPQQQSSAQRPDETKIRKLLSDRELPLGFVANFPQAELFDRLTIAEKSMDAKILLHQMRVHEATLRPSTMQRKFRIFMSSTLDSPKGSPDFPTSSHLSSSPKVDVQAGQSSDVSLEQRSREQDFKDNDGVDEDGQRSGHDSAPLSGLVASDDVSMFDEKVPRPPPGPPRAWTFRLEGYILDSTHSYPVVVGKKFSEFLKKVVITDLNPSISSSADNQEPEHLFEWTKTMISKETDGFEVKRRLSIEQHNAKAIELKIFLIFDHVNDKFVPSSHLRSILGLPANDTLYTKSALFVEFWRYLVVNALLDPATGMVSCNQPLKDLFKQDSFALKDLPERFQDFLLFPPPLELSFTLNLDEKQDMATTKYHDLVVDLPDPRSRSLTGITPAISKEVQFLDTKITEIMQVIHNQYRRRQWLDSFAKDPNLFIKDYFDSYLRENETIFADTKIPTESMNSATFFKNASWLPEAMFQYLNSREV